MKKHKCQNLPTEDEAEMATEDEEDDAEMATEDEEDKAEMAIVCTKPVQHDVFRKRSQIKLDLLRIKGKVFGTNTNTPD